MREQRVAQLWKEHQEAPFPARLRGTDVAGVEMVSLDAYAAGCIITWLDNGGHLDDWRWDILATCESRLERMLPHLAGAEAAYCRRLLDMAVLILED